MPTTNPGTAMKTTAAITAVSLALSICAVSCQKHPAELERPERIVSLRQVMYDSSTYARLSQLWKGYYDAYPSEDAYGNWMYALGYASEPDEQYMSQLEEGLERYPASPMLLYLLGKHKTTHGEYVEGTQLLEKSAALDPRYPDPWFTLVVSHLSRADLEKADVALRHILESGAIQDEVMDFSYNMLACLEPRAILIVNGDNDTYPGWILTRIVKYRPDVSIVNRSLLNTEWYPQTVVNDGVPPFTSKTISDSLRREAAEDFKRAKERKTPLSDVAFLGDRLVARIVDAAGRAGRPVYIACTVYGSNFLKDIASRGRELGLVTLVTPSSRSHDSQIRDVLNAWVRDFRTGGLDGWQIRYEKGAPAGRRLLQNYAEALYSLREPIAAAGGETRLGLFRWYRDHLHPLLSDETTAKVDAMWCSSTAPQEIREWCGIRGIRP
jgi:tetratricopeptide (TPR) repeat protein